MDEKHDVREQSSHSIPCLATIKEKTQSQPIIPVKLYSVVFHPSEPLIAAGSSDGKVRLFGYSPDNPSSLSCVAKFDGGYKILYCLTGYSDICKFIERMPWKLPFGVVTLPGFSIGRMPLRGFMRAIDTGSIEYGIWELKKNPMKRIKEQAIAHGFQF